MALADTVMVAGAVAELAEADNQAPVDVAADTVNPSEPPPMFVAAAVFDAGLTPTFVLNASEAGVTERVGGLGAATAPPRFVTARSAVRSPLNESRSTGVETPADVPPYSPDRYCWKVQVDHMPMAPGSELAVLSSKAAHNGNWLREGRNPPA